MYVTVMYFLWAHAVQYKKATSQTKSFSSWEKQNKEMTAMRYMFLKGGSQQMYD